MREFLCAAPESNRLAFKPRPPRPAPPRHPLIRPAARPDAKNALYQQAIKEGDLLLNRLQKLSKVIDIE